MSHEHNHHAVKNIKLAFFLNLGFTIIELVGGYFVNSIAIISDAVHDLGDSLSLGTAWFLQNKSGNKRDEKYSFGYARFSLLGALINCIILIAGSVFVIIEAVERLQNPEASNAQGMLFFALLGILVNGFAAWKLSHGHSLNENIISWHLIEDVLGWFAILVGSIILLFADIPKLDPILSLLITLFILWNVFKNLRKTLFIFLQGIPDDIKIATIERDISAVPNVDSVHHTHIWSLEGQHHVFTTHVKLKNIQNMDQLLKIKQSIKNILANYPFRHYTIETELDEESCGLPQNESQQHSH
jgi:cobalt-zinc-cadmium efflux system protein